MEQKECPWCGEVMSGGATICMVCGRSQRQSRTIKKEYGAAVVFAVMAIVLGYILFPIFFGPTTVTSTGDVWFDVSLSDGSTSVAYKGTADGRDLADLQLAILAEGGRSSQIFSFAYPEPGTVLGPVETGILGKPVGVYYVAVYADGTDISDTMII